MVPFAESSRRCHTAPRCTAIRFTCGGVMRRDHRAWPDERDESAVDGVGAPGLGAMLFPVLFAWILVAAGVALQV